MNVGCYLDVPGIAGTPQSSVLVMTDADWAGDVKDRRSLESLFWAKGFRWRHVVRNRTWFA